MRALLAALSLLLCVGATPARAENLFLEIVTPPSSTVGGSLGGATFSVTVNVRDADNGNAIIPLSRVPVPFRTLTLTPSSAQGTLSVTSILLSSGTITFSDAYSAAIPISISGSVDLRPPGAGLTTGSSASISFNPDTFSQIVQILPGEAPVLGGTIGGPGKTGAPTQRTTNVSFPVSVRAADEYWNVVTTVVDTARLTTLPAGNYSGTTSLAFINGIADFNVAINTDFCSLTVNAQAVTAGFNATSDTVASQSPFYFQLDVPPSATVGPPATFPVTLTLRHQSDSSLVANSAICSPNPTVAISMLEGGVPTSGITNVTSVVLSQSSFTFTEAQTRARTMQMHASATLLGAAVTGNSVPFNLTPAAYIKVLLLMPWEAALAEGNNTATGKTGAPPAFITRNSAQAATVRAVDQYWNIVSGAVGTAHLDTSPSGFIGGVNSLAFSGGLANFTVSVTTVGYNIGIIANDSSNGAIFSQTDTVNVFPPGTNYVFQIPAITTMTPVTFDLKAILVDGTGSTVTFATHNVNLTVTQTTPAAGFSLGTASGNLASGVLDIPTQTISRTGTYKVTANDAFGFTGTSSLIIAMPENHHYTISVPATSTFGQSFGITVTRIDNATGLPVARTRTLTLTGYFLGGAPLSPPATLAPVNQSMTLGTQGYSETFSYPVELITSSSFYMVLQTNLDGDNLSPYSILGATSTVILAQPAPAGSLTLSVTSPLTVPGGTATLQSILRSSGETHRIPGQTVAFSLITGTGTVAPASAVGDAAGAASTVLMTSATLMSNYYLVGASFGAFLSSTTVFLDIPPTTTLSTIGEASTGANGTLILKTNTQIALTGHSYVGISSVEYQLDGGATQIYSGPFTLNLGAHTLNYFSIDLFNLSGVPISQLIEVSALTTGPSQIVNFPNPFKAGSGVTTIEWNLSSGGDVTLEIYTQVGGLVLRRSFSSGTEGGRTGLNQFVWPGRNDYNEVVGNGVYFAVLKTPEGRLVRKIAVVK